MFDNMAGVAVFISIAFAFFVGGLINIALSPVIYQQSVSWQNNTLYYMNNTMYNNSTIVRAGYDDTIDTLYSVWRLSPMIFFFASAMFGWQAIRRRSSPYG